MYFFSLFLAGRWCRFVGIFSGSFTLFSFVIIIVECNTIFYIFNGNFFFITFCSFSCFCPFYSLLNYCVWFVSFLLMSCQLYTTIQHQIHVLMLGSPTNSDVQPPGYLFLCLINRPCAVLEWMWSIATWILERLVKHATHCMQYPQWIIWKFWTTRMATTRKLASIDSALTHDFDDHCPLLNCFGFSFLNYNLHLGLVTLTRRWTEMYTNEIKRNRDINFKGTRCMHMYCIHD